MAKAPQPWQELRSAASAKRVSTGTAILLYLSTGIALSAFFLVVNTSLVERALQLEGRPEDVMWFYGGVLFAIAAAWGVCAFGSLELHKKAGEVPLYAGFVLSAITTTSLVSDIEITREITSLSLEQIWTIALTAILAQLIFAIQAWTLRRHGWRRALAGCHSGVILAVFNSLAALSLAILQFVDQPVRLALNGEVWPLIGAAQLLVALTSGWSECRAVHSEVKAEEELARLPARRPCPRRPDRVRPPRTPAGRCIHTAPRLIHEPR